jgi:hypothetical protein
MEEVFQHAQPFVETGPFPSQHRHGAKMDNPAEVIATVYEARKSGINRFALVSRGLQIRPELQLLLGDDGFRVWVREWPHTSRNVEDDWQVLWEYKHFDIPGYVHPVIDALFTANAVEDPLPK